MPNTAKDAARVVLESACDGRVVVSVPKSHYRIDFVDDSKGVCARREIGRPFNAIIHASALKMHRASGGGTFIEPVDGHPRIVQGRILATDATRNKTLVHAVVPIWISVPQGQAAADFTTGELVNFYVESGASIASIDG
ncbi:MAG: hypothetical protein EXS03_04080 [Phycisphaerales bacterium]|nr:hypothetical protein [Phycisphaerales bacterium]